MKTTLTASQLTEQFPSIANEILQSKRSVFVVPNYSPETTYRPSDTVPLIRIDKETFILCGDSREAVETLLEYPQAMKGSSKVYNPMTGKSVDPLKYSGDFRGLSLPAVQYPTPQPIDDPVQALRESVSDDRFRPALTGVFLDRERGVAVATDTSQLAAYRCSDFSKYEKMSSDINGGGLVVKPSPISLVDETYPNYDSVIPREFAWESEPIALSEIYDYLKTIIRLCALVKVGEPASGIPAVIAAPVDGELQAICFNPVVMVCAVTSLLHSGVQTVRLQATEIYSIMAGRKCNYWRLVMADVDGNAIGVIMPLRERLNPDNCFVLTTLTPRTFTEEPFYVKPPEPPQPKTRKRQPKKSAVPEAAAEPEPTSEPVTELPTGEQHVPPATVKLPKQCPDVGTALLSVALPTEQAVSDRDISLTGIIYDNDREIFATSNGRFILTEPDSAPDERHGVFGCDGEPIAEALPLAVYNPCDALPDDVAAVAVDPIPLAALYKQSVGVAQAMERLGVLVSVRFAWDVDGGTVSLHCDPIALSQAYEGLARLGVSDVVIGYGYTDSGLSMVMVMDTDDWARSAVLPTVDSRQWQTVAHWYGEGVGDYRGIGSMVADTVTVTA